MKRSPKANRPWASLALVAALALLGCVHPPVGAPPSHKPDPDQPPSACEAPKVWADGGCCWPGQAWSEATGCQGAPACPEGYAKEGLDCTPVEIHAREACERGEPPACLQAASLYEQRQAWPDALDALGRGCDLKQADACQRLAGLWTQGFADTPSDPNAACAWWSKACEAGSPQGCTEAGRCAWPDEPAQALGLWEKGCQLQDPASCEARTDQQAQLCARGEAPWTDATRWARVLETLQQDHAAARLYRAACSARWLQGSTSDPDLGACEALTDLAARVEPQDPPLALELWGFSCLTRWDELGWEGDPRACERLGDAKLTSQAWAEAGDHLGRACQGMSGQPGLKAACERLWTAGTERERAGDLEHAGKLHAHGCSALYPKNCRDAGRTWRARDAGERADAKAARWLEQGCDFGDWGACALLGRMMEDGRGLEKNVSGAADLYERACEAREWPACVSLGELYLAGRGVERDEARGKALMRRACKGGWKPACGRG